MLGGLNWRAGLARSIAAAVVVAAVLLGVAPLANAQPGGPRDPIIFVHGYVGSGGQFESQKLRFVENGYPDNYVTVIEYDSTPATPVPGTSGLNPVGIQVIEQQLFPRLDQLIAQLKAQTGRPKVELVAHSLGTTLMQDYLKSDPARAANVADYVNVDGQTATSPPGGVRTLALWATKGPLSPPGRSITGAKNVTIPDATHVQCVTSSVSFREMYEFFTGSAPATTDILPQRGPITLAGKVLDFPDNTGLAGSTLQVWPVDDATGQRTSNDPIATYQIDTSGDFGPVTAQPGRRYEFALLRPGVPVHHFYYEPFVRSDHLIRLLESDALRNAGGAPSTNSVAMVLIRYKELWGDQGAQSDVLTIDGINACSAAICPLNHLVNALFAADFDRDNQSSTSMPNQTYYQLPFVSGVDIYVPAQNPPVGKVTVTLRSRGQGPLHTLTFPNFVAATDVVTVQLNDFEQAVSATPTPAACVRRQRLVIRIRQPRHGRIVRVQAYINGRLVKRVRGHRVTRITLRRPRRADFRVVVAEYTADGRRILIVRHFHRCGKTRRA
jgi:pimeloyl-ACP methyl ester carboxylesterase